MAIIDLFGDSEEGAWWDASDTSTLYQDSGATTPATALTDPVGYIADKSGNDHHAIQTTSDLRPTIGSGPGGTFALSFDASNDYLINADSALYGIQTGGDPCSGFVIFNAAASSTFQTICGFGGASTSPQYRVRVNDDNTLDFFSRNSAASNPAEVDLGSVDGSDHVVVWSSDGDTITFLLDGVLIGYLAAATNTTSTFTDFVLGAWHRGTFPQPLNGTISSCAVLDRGLTFADIQDIHEYANDTFGLSLPVYTRVNVDSEAFATDGFVARAGFNDSPAIPEVASTSEHAIREPGNILYEPADTGEEYKVWYTGVTSGGVETIHYAYSSDGETWTKSVSNPVIDGVSRENEDPYVVKSGSTYHMYTEDKTDPNQLRHYTSSDGVSWSDQGEPSGLTGGNPQSPTVWIEGSTWYMLYEDVNVSPPTMRLATSSDGSAWTESGANPVLEVTDISWLTTGVVPDDIQKIGNTYYLSIHDAGSATPVGIVTSTNLTDWTDYHETEVEEKTGDGDNLIHLQITRIAGNDLALFYTPDSNGLSIGYLAATEIPVAAGLAFVRNTVRETVRDTVRNTVS